MSSRLRQQQCYACRRAQSCHCVLQRAKASRSKALASSRTRWSHSTAILWAQSAASTTAAAGPADTERVSRLEWRGCGQTLCLRHASAGWEGVAE